MRGNEDGLAHVLQGAQNAFHVRACPGIHAGGGLIQDQQMRVVDQGVGQAQALLHATGQRVHIGVTLVSKLDQFQQLTGHAAAHVPVQTVAPGIEVQVLPDLQVPVHAEEVRHVSDQPPCLCRLPENGYAVHDGGTGNGPQERGQDPHGGGLSGAVGADKAVELSVPDGHAQVIQGHVLSIGHGKFRDFKHLCTSLPEKWWALGYPCTVRCSYPAGTGRRAVRPWKDRFPDAQCPRQVHTGPTAVFPD